MHLNIHFHYFSTEITSSIQPVGRFIYHAKNLTVSTLITWAMHAEILKKLLVFLFQRKGIEIREDTYFRVLYGLVDRSVSNQHSLPSLLPTITLSPTHKKCEVITICIQPILILTYQQVQSVRSDSLEDFKILKITIKLTCDLPPGWIEMEEISRRPDSSFFTN